MFGFGNRESGNAEIAEQEAKKAELTEAVRVSLDKIGPFASESAKDTESINKMIEADEKHKADLVALKEALE